MMRSESWPRFGEVVGADGFSLQYREVDLDTHFTANTMPTCKAPLPSSRPPPLTTVPSPGWRAYVWSAVPGAASSLPSPALVGLVDDLTVGPGLVLNKPPFRLSIVGPRACHNVNAYRPFARSGQRVDDHVADTATHL